MKLNSITPMFQSLWLLTVNNQNSAWVCRKADLKLKIVWNLSMDINVEL